MDTTVYVLQCAGNYQDSYVERGTKPGITSTALLSKAERFSTMRTVIKFIGANHLIGNYDIVKVRVVDRPLVEIVTVVS